MEDVTRAPRLLHITADHPDRIDRSKTRAVANLIAAAGWAEHRVISLNRVAGPRFDRTMVMEAGGVTPAVYFGLPFGVGLGIWMDRVARRIAEHVERAGWRPDLLHAHKLTFEGLVAHQLSRRWGIPFCVTVRGSTDTRVVRAKPLMHGRFRQILSDAAQVFFLAPWARSRIGQQLGTGLEHALVLPNVCVPLHPVESQAANPHRFASVFHSRNPRTLRIKNARRLFSALQLLHQRGLGIQLDVIGSANESEQEQMKALARHHGAGDCVQPLLAMNREELAGRLPGYAGLVLPSYPETFGLVYIEALESGIPIIHSRNSGIDGYFSDPLVASAVDHRSVEGIAQAIEFLVRNQHAARQHVRELIRSGGLDRFRPEQVGRAYFEALAPILRLRAEDGRVPQ